MCGKITNLLLQRALSVLPSPFHNNAVPSHNTSSPNTPSAKINRPSPNTSSAKISRETPLIPYIHFHPAEQCIYVSKAATAREFSMLSETIIVWEDESSAYWKLKTTEQTAPEVIIKALMLGYKFQSARHEASAASGGSFAMQRRPTRGV
jgi:hypothetical protein